MVVVMIAFSFSPSQLTSSLYGRDQSQIIVKFDQEKIETPHFNLPSTVSFIYHLSNADWLTQRECIALTDSTQKLEMLTFAK